MQVVVGHVRGKVGERLPTGTTDSDEQRVTARLLDDASDARNVFDRKSESNRDVTIDRYCLSATLESELTGRGRASWVSCSCC